MEHLTSRQLGAMLEQGAISASVAHRRQTLIAVAERAKRSKTHTPGSRQRLRVFRAYLESEQNNDEVEVTGETFCEGLDARDGRGIAASRRLIIASTDVIRSYKPLTP